MEAYVTINGAQFSTSVTYTKKEFFERFKDKIKYPWDCEDTWSQLIKFIPKAEKQEKEK